MTTQGQSEEKRGYTLYHDVPSMCSQMVRFVWALRDKSKDQISVKLKRINIMTGEQFDEDYLVHVYWKGQVPVLLSNDADATPLPDSEDITNFLLDLYPELKGPAEHQTEISEFTHALHQINFYAMSFPDRPKLTYGHPQMIKARLANPEISERYRKALGRKLAFWDLVNIKCMEPVKQQENNKAATKLLERLGQVLEQHGTGSKPQSWLYGSTPTALDAHLTVFLARLEDINHLDLVPEILKSYKDWVTKERTEWREMMGGLRTMPPRD